MIDLKYIRIKLMENIGKNIIKSIYKAENCIYKLSEMKEMNEHVVDYIYRIDFLRYRINSNTHIMI